MNLSSNTLKTGSFLPVIALLWAATFWGAVWYPLRLLESAGLSGLWTTWVIFATAALPGLWMAWSKRTELLEQPGLMLLIAVANGWLNTAFVLAMLDGNVLRVLLLFYLSPLWSTLLAWWWLGERPSRFGVATLATEPGGLVGDIFRHGFLIFQCGDAALEAFVRPAQGRCGLVGSGAGGRWLVAGNAGTMARYFQ